MTVLCIEPIPATTDYTFTEVSTSQDCSAFVALHSSDASMLGMTYQDANQVFAATALLFSTAFILRLVLKKMGF